MKSKDFLNDEWSQKYKRSINCASPKGFSQRAHCAGRNKNESIDAHIGEQQAAEGTIITKDDLVDIYIKGVGKNKMPIQKKIGAQIPNSKVNSFIATVAEKYGLNPKAFVYGPSNPVAEDRHPNDRPYGPETKPTMPAGTVRVDVSDVYDWYKLGMHISDLEGLGKHDFGKGPPSTIFSFGSEEQEHKYIKDLEKTGLTTTDIDPKDPNQPKGMKRQKVDPTFNVNEKSQGVEEGFGRNRGYSHGFASPHAPSLGGRREREDDEGYGQEEQNNYAVVIDGRTWKVFADKQQAENIARSLRNKGKKASVGITGANPSESVTETDAELAEPPERPRKQQTATKQKSKLDPNMFAPKQDQPLAKVDPLDDLKKKAGIGRDEPKVNIKKASQKTTLDKTAGIGSDDMADMLGRLRNIEVDRDLEAYPEPEPPEQLPSVEVNTANLPVVAGQALQAAGVQNPDFHQVANLPGNMADQIRQLGKSLFASLTMTPTKRIHVVANLGGQGPNTSAEVNAVAGFLKDHGKDLGPGDIDFENVMPGYKAQTHMFTAAGIRWMLVKDFAGQYIYCWPEEDSHDAQDAIGQGQDVKKLK